MSSIAQVSQENSLNQSQVKTSGSLQGREVQHLRGEDFLAGFFDGKAFEHMFIGIAVFIAAIGVVIATVAAGLASHSWSVGAMAGLGTAGGFALLGVIFALQYQR